MRVLFCVPFLLFCFSSYAQYAFNSNTSFNNIPGMPTPGYIETSFSTVEKRKLFQRNSGIILGLQKGRNTAIELGGEAHWRKISLSKPHIIGATANMEYNFSSNVVGYKAGLWMKKGRINFTYGGNVSYYTNFKGGSRYGIGPSIGFRLLGLHLVNGLTILTKDNGTKENPVEVNSLYLSIRYYFPVENKFTWDRKTMKKKRERRKEREKRKNEREKDREDKNNDKGEGGAEKRSLKDLFKIKKKQEESMP